MWPGSKVTDEVSLHRIYNRRSKLEENDSLAYKWKIKSIAVLDLRVDITSTPREYQSPELLDKTLTDWFKTALVASENISKRRISK